MHPTLFRALGSLLLVLFVGVQSSAAQTTLPVPAEVTGTLRQDASLQFADRGSFDVYAFYAVAGVRYSLSVSSDAFFPHLSVMRVVGPLTELVRDQASGTGQTQLTFRVPQSGRHYVVVQAGSALEMGDNPEPAAGGRYTLSLSERPNVPAPAPRPIALGATIESQLGPQSALMFNSWEAEVPYEPYSIFLEAGQRARISMEAADFDAYLELLSDLSGEAPVILAQDDDGGTGSNALLHFTPETTGMYFIRARSFGPDALGSYTLRTEIRATPPPPTPIPIAIGMRRSGTLSAESSMMDTAWSQDVAYDLYTLQVPPGQSFTIHMQSEAFDTYVEFGRLTAEGFVEINSNDDGGEGSNAMLRVVDSEGGNFAIRARAYSTNQYGEYTLRLEPYVPRDPTRSPIQVGQTVNASLSVEDALTVEGVHFQEFTFQAMQGRSYTIRMRSEAFDAYLSLGVYDNGVYRELEFNDDFPEDGLNAGITFTATDSREMVIRARSLGMGSTGAYTLALTANTR